ncbi:MAG: cellulose biosynthesis protein BcsS [Alphaproteobacteria bacterium]
MCWKRVIAVALAAALLLEWHGEGLIASAQAAKASYLSGKTRSGGQRITGRSARQSTTNAAQHQSAQRARKHYVDFSSGGGLSDHSKSTYGTATIALGRPLDQDGWRMRLSGGYGVSLYNNSATKRCDTAAQDIFRKTGIQFSGYCQKLTEHTLPDSERRQLEDKLTSLGYKLTSEDKINKIRAVKMETYEAAIMPGYQITFGPLIVKAFAGLAYNGGTATSLNPNWPAELRFDELWGARTALETWLTLSDTLWFSFDASYGVAFQNDQKNDLVFHDYAANARLGFRALPWLTLGPEASTFGKHPDVDASYDALGDADLSEACKTTRAGGFLRLRFHGTETTLSGGLSIDSDENKTTYGAASIYTKF